jgi:hypothetical protein
LSSEAWDNIVAAESSERVRGELVLEPVTVSMSRLGRRDHACSSDEGSVFERCTEVLW